MKRSLRKSTKRVKSRKLRNMRSRRVRHHRKYKGGMLTNYPQNQAQQNASDDEDDRDSVSTAATEIYDRSQDNNMMLEAPPAPQLQRQGQRQPGLINNVTSMFSGIGSLFSNNNNEPQTGGKRKYRKGKKSRKTMKKSRKSRRR